VDIFTCSNWATTPLFTLFCTTYCAKYVPPHGYYIVCCCSAEAQTRRGRYFGACFSVCVKKVELENVRAPDAVEAGETETCQTPPFFFLSLSLTHSLTHFPVALFPIRRFQVGQVEWWELGGGGFLRFRVGVLCLVYTLLCTYSVR
jgi:hypothetical protein